MKYEKATQKESESVRKNTAVSGAKQFYQVVKLFLILRNFWLKMNEPTYSDNCNFDHHNWTSDYFD